ncbi:MAG: SIMPL domain-containing protein [Xanthobacteraceae bacterium]|nr:SIMPL domain-containing protein [Xanthobacteraceae bacterium]
MRYVAAAMLVAMALNPAMADTDPPSVSVSGEATIAVAPDRAEISAGVTSQGKTAKQASEVNNKAMGDVLLALKGAGVDQKDLQTSQLSLQPLFENRNANSGGQQQIVGYRASNRVTVKLRDVGMVANTIDALVGAGANDIDGVSFAVSQTSKLLDDARTKAMDDAHRKAEIYAQAAGMTLGLPLSISEDGAAPPAIFRKMAMRAAAAPAPIAPGEDTLRVSVNVTYELKPKTP